MGKYTGNYKSNGDEGIWSSNHQTGLYLLESPFRGLVTEQFLTLFDLFLLPALTPRHRKIIKEQELKITNGIFQ